ncbi:unnamed protein product [Victoria cruziana]
MATLPGLQQGWRIVPGNDGWTFEAFELSPSRPAESPSADEPTRLPSMADLLLQAYPAMFCDASDGASVEDENYEGGGGQMFHTASGKPVAVKESSIKRAVAVLGEGGMPAAGQAVCNTAYVGSSFSSSLFQSGSGKTIKLSSKSLNRASNLLSDNKQNFSNAQKQQHILNHVCDTGQQMWDGGGDLEDKSLLSVGQETMCYTKPLIPVSGHKRHLPGPTCMYLSAKESDSGADVHAKTMGSEVDLVAKEPQIKFQTAGGRSISVSDDALKRAMKLLGASKFGMRSCDISFGDSLCYSSFEKDFNMISCSKEDIHLTHSFKPKYAINEGLTEKLQPCLETLAQSNPLISTSNLNSTSSIGECIGVTDYKCMHTEGEIGYLLGDTSCSKENHTNSADQGELQRSDGSPKKKKSGQFVDIPNVNHGESSVSPIGLLSTYCHEPSPNGEKRRLGWRSSISPTPSNLHRPTFNLGSTSGVSEWNASSDYICKHTEREIGFFLEDASSSKELQINSPMQDKLQGPDGSPRKQQNCSFIDISNDNHGESSVPPFGLLSAYSRKPSPNGEKRRFGRRSSISPFKQPRQSRFFAPPLNGILCKDAQIQSALSCADAKSTTSSISTHYPFQQKRKSLVEFFQLPPHQCSSAENLSDKVKHMSAETAASFTFSAASASSGVGSEVLWKILIESGASPTSCNKEWTANHYKWIVWKLAALERCYPGQVGGKLLTAANVLEELKYRYEREVNHGHRSAIKKILEGDAVCSSMMILCISAVHYRPYKKIETLDKTEVTSRSSTSIDDLGNPVKHEVAKIELTDGWYSVNAVLDVPLSRQFALGKLFIGQKLRVCGASLCGWVAPVSPLEAGGNVAMSLHINGTFRTHWAEKLGFCKGYKSPLSFRCINVNGGAVLRTLVGVARLYPLLYKERLQQGGSVIRSERMESKMMQIYKQSMVAEEIMSELHGENFGSSDVAEDESEGAKIFKLLETAAEPEILMETLTEQQLIAYKNFQSKQEERRNSEIKKRVEMALDGAGLRSREVTPFLRVHVIGMTLRNSRIRKPCRKGLITIWEPTEKQLLDLEEGQVYSVTGLVPVSLNNDILQLQTRGSRTKWACLRQSASIVFEPFFTPRKSISLSCMDEVPISSEFDIAGVIVYVGELYLSGNHRKQWVFLTDGSISDSRNSPNSLLAISFSLSTMDAESCAPVHSALTGSTVVFCNLVKRVRDEADQLWVAEATENSTYSFSCSSPGLSHLKGAADYVNKWSKKSSAEIEKLRERVLGIIGV